MHKSTSSTIVPHTVIRIVCLKTQTSRTVNPAITLVASEALYFLVVGRKCPLMQHCCLFLNNQAAFSWKTAFRQAEAYVARQIILSTMKV